MVALPLGEPLEAGSPRSKLWQQQQPAVVAPKGAAAQQQAQLSLQAEQEQQQQQQLEQAQPAAAQGAAQQQQQQPQAAGFTRHLTSYQQGTQLLWKSGYTFEACRAGCLANGECEGFGWYGAADGTGVGGCYWGKGFSGQCGGKISGVFYTRTSVAPCTPRQ